MSQAFVLRFTTYAVAAILAVLNALHLAYGLPRLRRRIAAGEVSASLATPFTVAWLYIGLAGVAFSVLLFVSAPGLIAGQGVARNVVLTIALTLIALGVCSYALARKHPGLLFIAVFGIVLLAPIVAFQ